MGSKALRVRTVVALAQACGISRITIKRLWEPKNVLPSATLIDARGVRWYSDAYVKSAATIVKRWRKDSIKRRVQRNLRELAGLFRLEWASKAIR